MIEVDGFDIVVKVYMVFEGENLQLMVKMMGFGIMELVIVFGNFEFDVVVIIVDCYEMLVMIVVVSYMNILVVYVQGGEVIGLIDEKVCYVVIKLLDLYFVFIEGVVECVFCMGECCESVYVMGCLLVDIVCEVFDS